MLGRRLTDEEIEARARPVAKVVAREAVARLRALHTDEAWKRYGGLFDVLVFPDYASIWFVSPFVDHQVKVLPETTVDEAYEAMRTRLFFKET